MESAGREPAGLPARFFLMVPAGGLQECWGTDDEVRKSSFCGELQVLVTVHTSLFTSR